MADERYEILRARMVREQLERRGIEDPRVLEAMGRIPRERFVPVVLRRYAYDDRALSIGRGQTISQPYMVAVMTAALGIAGGERVLEIGTGSGYQAAVFAALGAEVYTIERIPSLADAARARLETLGFDNVTVKAGDGSCGWAEHAPYAGILVAAAAPAVPDALLGQLDPSGGRLVLPIGERDLQDLVLLERVGESWTSQSMLACRFVPLLGEEGW
jgi:protein-L-isoaspartate(D-aspartate) O-methyltransferase